MIFYPLLPLSTANDQRELSGLQGFGEDLAPNNFVPSEGPFRLCCVSAAAYDGKFAMQCPNVFLQQIAYSLNEPILAHAVREQNTIGTSQ